MIRHLFVLLTLGACFHPTYDNPKCGPAGECPSGLTCIANVCTNHSSSTDGNIDTTSSNSDAAVDSSNAPVCTTPLSCTAPTGSTQLTICGQLYDFQTNAALLGTGTATCDPANPTTSGPCALHIDAFDAIAFGSGPTTAVPLSVGSLTIDTCGRYRLAAIETSGTGPYIGLRIDDVGPVGPSGSTNTVFLAAAKADGPLIQNFEAWIVKPTTTSMWQSTGGPTLSSTGIFAPVFRAHKIGNGDPLQPQGAGVQITKSGSPISTAGPGPAYYFTAIETTRTTVDTTKTTTGANSTGLVTNAAIADSAAYSGTGGLGAGCRWATYAGASMPGIVFIEVFRKIDIVGQTCND